MKDSYEDEEEEIEGPKSSFSTYLAEGDALYKQGEYKKALESYRMALEIQPNDKICLVSRSKCYLMLGDPQAALSDAEAALEEDKEFNKGLYQKAEALYSMGDFEYALMYYHRGHKLRPELDEFRLGIQKAQEAIDNSIGNAAKVKLENKGDLSFFTKQDDLGKKSKGYSKPATNKAKIGASRNKETKAPAPSNKTVKQLLGELYADKEYLEKLMQDTDFIKSESNKKIHELVEDGLTYLNKRTDFWRQQKPLYARKKDKMSSQKKNVLTKDQVSTKKMAKFMKKLEEIDAALSDGHADKSLKLAKSTLKEVEETSSMTLNNRDEIIANLHSCIGNALLDLEKPQKALKHHLEDFNISEKNKHKDGESRALDNIGRSYARTGNYEKAIENWKKKLPLVKTPLESTWLRHEIGRCHFEMGEYDEARDYGEQSLEAAKEAEDEVWQLNASVLIAQADVKLNDFEKAKASFGRSMDLAKSLDDEAAQNAIAKAMDDLESQVANGESGEGEGDQAEEKQEQAEPETQNASSEKNDEAIGDKETKETDEQSKINDDQEEQGQAEQEHGQAEQEQGQVEQEQGQVVAQEEDAKQDSDDMKPDESSAADKNSGDEKE
ncbi:outer dynein arm-docking complex subunit 4-like isoform X2 [Rhopilema esculentum]|uniref:outer dynein arm-docking complex subunit 4-like isoform X2 n=1 Tax=Rhopilema esculentum TaxID=499914 RepID=UPI0031D6701A|eukprot:gene13248-4076_t